MRMILPAIPFNKPYMTGNELDYIKKVYLDGKLAGDGAFTKKCHVWLESNIFCKKALLTHSCTVALEMCALLLNIEPGDEVILPSYTFVSTANAFVLRGAIPIFVDIRTDTLNIDETLIEAAITDKTRAIVVVHYAGVACEMDAIMDIAWRHNIPVVEDAAQAITSWYKGKPLGSIGHLAALSFHEAKNIISGEGGAILVNDENMVDHSESICAKGTDRSKFLRGEVDKYSWQGMGSSVFPSELISAFLWAQLEEVENVKNIRLKSWNIYRQLLESFEDEGLISRQTVPAHCGHNAHMFYIILPKGVDRQVVLDFFMAHNISALFHYVPLHSSPAGQKFGRVSGNMHKTDDLSERIIRLPLYTGISVAEQERVVEVLGKALKN